MFQQLQYLNFTEDLGTLFFGSFRAADTPKGFLSPARYTRCLAQWNPLCGPARADGLVAVLNVCLGPSEQPFAQVQVDVPDSPGSSSAGTLRYALQRLLSLIFCCKVRTKSCECVSIRRTIR